MYDMIPKSSRARSMPVSEAPKPLLAAGGSTSNGMRTSVATDARNV